MIKIETITPEQCRGARALLDWTQLALAEKSSISRVSVRAFEGGREMRESNQKLLRKALEDAGIVFQAAGEMVEGGQGVRLKD